MIGRDRVEIVPGGPAVGIGPVLGQIAQVPTSADDPGSRWQLFGPVCDQGRNFLNRSGFGLADVQGHRRAVGAERAGVTVGIVDPGQKRSNTLVPDAICVLTSLLDPTAMIFPSFTAAASLMQKS